MLRRAQNYFTSKFFAPNKQFSSDAITGPLNYESVQFPSKSGRTLHGMFIKAKPPVLGTVVHCHGNTGSILDHVPLVEFLSDAGCNVLLFDYGGYGRSEGRPTPPAIINDARAALDYCRQRPDVNRDKIALFGQSLGGAAAAGAMAREHDIRCLILEGTFTTYRAMAWATMLGRVLFPITPFVIPDIGPLYDLSKIAPRHALIVHGERDSVVPVRFGRALHRLHPSNTTLVTLKNLRHLEGEELEPRYRESIIGFLRLRLAATLPSDRAPR